MDRIKTFRKYIIWIILFYIFTMIMTYVGLNSTYRNMTPKEEIGNPLKIDIAQSTKVNGRIMGEVTSTEENQLDGKYIKIQIYNKRDDLMGVKYLKIENTKINEPKKFVAYFTAEDVEYYDVEIINDSDEARKEMDSITERFKDVFNEKELQKGIIWTFVLWALFT